MTPLPKVFGSLIVCLLLAGCRHGGGRPQSKPLRAQAQGFVFEYAPTAFHQWKAVHVPRQTLQEIGDDMPIDNGPAHLRFVLKCRGSALVPAAELKDREALLEILPLQDPSVPDFRAAYPELAGNVQALPAILKGAVPKTAPESVLLDWNCVDEAQTIHAKAHPVQLENCDGLEYLTTYTQEETGIDNATLTYVFQGLSHDGRYYLSARIPLAHPSLPLHAPYLDQAPGESNEQYSARVTQTYLQVEQSLNGQSDESFQPSLPSLRQMVGSLRTADR